MNQNDKKTFFEMLGLTASMYSKELTAPQAAMFFELLEGYDIKNVIAAFKAHMRTSMFFPVPANIIDLMPIPKKVVMRDGCFYAIRSGKEVRVFNPTRAEIEQAMALSVVEK